MTVAADRPRWSAEATLRFSGTRADGTRPRLGRRLAVVAATVCGVLLLGAPAGRYSERVPAAATRHRRHVAAPAVVAPAAAPAPVAAVTTATEPPPRARLDAVLVLGAERRATFRLDGRSLTLQEGERLGGTEIVAIESDGVALRGAANEWRLLRLGDDVAFE